MKIRWSAILLLASFSPHPRVHAQHTGADAVLAALDQRAPSYSDIALKIWALAEVGYQEEQSSAARYSSSN